MVWQAAVGGIAAVPGGGGGRRRSGGAAALGPPTLPAQLAVLIREAAAAFLRTPLSKFPGALRPKP